MLSGQPAGCSLWLSSWAPAEAKHYHSLSTVNSPAQH